MKFFCSKNVLRFRDFRRVVALLSSIVATIRKWCRSINVAFDELCIRSTCLFSKFATVYEDFFAVTGLRKTEGRKENSGVNKSISGYIKENVLNSKIPAIFFIKFHHFLLMFKSVFLYGLHNTKLNRNVIITWLN